MPELQKFLDSRDVVLYEAVKPSGAKAGVGADGEPADDAAKIATTKRRIARAQAAIEAELGER